MSELRDQLRKTLGGSYTLERELGGGGMSGVFLAREAGLGRQVVIKVLPTESGVPCQSTASSAKTRSRALQQANIVPLLAPAVGGGREEEDVGSSGNRGARMLRYAPSQQQQRNLTAQERQ